MRMPPNPRFRVLPACAVAALFLWGHVTPLFAQTAPSDAAAQREPRKPGGERPKGAKRDAATAHQPADVAALNQLSVILGRPTAQSITANVLAGESMECYLEYGTQSGAYPQKTPNVNLLAGQPAEVELSGLVGATSYVYRLRFRQPGQTEFSVGAEQRFHTQRKPGQPFVFELQGDSHPERPQQFDPGLYAQTLRSVAQDRPDFYITMGDDFSVDTLDVIDAETVTQRYRLQRPYLALVGQTAPLFLVNGNHEQAAAVNLNGTPNNVAVWAQTARNAYFPMPAPDQFYSGNGTPVQHIGLLRNYYGWTWGDALFLVIDPYWHSNAAVDNVFGRREKKGSDRLQDATRSWRNMWDISLGEAQYRWFKHALETSTARYKFVFAHHVLGTGRGGIEQAGLYEWGGKEKSGRDTFAQHRPGWEMPIHPLMVKTGVTVFFQGHDHVFARQELDGVTYQTLPQPADPNYATHYQDAYRSGDLLPNSGRVRVSVGAEKVRVEYIRSYLPQDASTEGTKQQPGYAYELAPRK